MSSKPLILKYPLDLTGIKPENLIRSEPHTLEGEYENRAIVPNYGAYYTESLTIRDRETDKVLIKGEQYKPVQLYQEATEKAGKEICAVIVVLDPEVSNQIEIDYQVVGGKLSHSVLALRRMIDDLDLDERPVSWGDIIGTPDSFPPAPHLHAAGDLYGFEYVVEALENLRQAILLGNQAEFDNIHDRINTIYDRHNELRYEHDNLREDHDNLRVDFDGHVVDIYQSLDEHKQSGDHDHRYYRQEQVDKILEDYYTDLIFIQPLIVEGEGEASHQRGESEDFGAVFNEWQRFSHQYGEQDQGNLDSWNYDAVVDRINSTANSPELIGMVSPENFDDFVFDVNLISDQAHNDWIGIVLAFAVDANGKEHTITAMRSSNVEQNWSGAFTAKHGIEDFPEWIVSYNYHGPTEPDGHTPFPEYVIYAEEPGHGRVIINDALDTTRATNLQPSSVWGAHWDAHAGTRVRVTRVGNEFTVQVTDHNDLSTNWVSGAGITFSLDDRPEFDVFKGGSRYGYAAHSMPNASFDTNLRPIDNNVIYDNVNHVTWEWQGNHWTQHSRDEYNPIDPLLHYYSPVYNRMYYSDEDAWLSQYSTLESSRNLLEKHTQKFNKILEDYHKDIIHIHPLVVEGDEEATNQRGENEDFGAVFNEWRRFSHYRGSETENNLNSWNYDSSTDEVYSTENTAELIGFVSPESYEEFVFDVTLSSRVEHGNYIGIVFAFAEDENGNEHTLTAMRAPRTSFNDAFASEYPISEGPCWIIAYNLHGKEHSYSGHSWIPQTALYYESAVDNYASDGGVASITNGTSNWFHEHCRLRVERNGDNFTVKTTDFGDTTDNWVEGATFTFNINDYPELELFKGGSPIGYCAQSEPGATFDTNLRPIDNNVIYDNVNHVTWEWQGDHWESFPRSVMNPIDPLLLYYSPPYGRFYHSDEEAWLRGVGQTGAPNESGLDVGVFNISGVGNIYIETGFRPGLIEFDAIYHQGALNSENHTSINDNNSMYAHSHGRATPSNQVAMGAGPHFDSPNATRTYVGEGYSVYLVVTSNSGETRRGAIRARVISFDDTGFTLEVDQAFNANGYVTYKAYRPSVGGRGGEGADVDMELLDSRYVNKTGDTVYGDLHISGTLYLGGYAVNYNEDTDSLDFEVSDGN